ncbi:MAG: hypothetical protein ACREQY_08130 [Candidatus Binatia bacterium]
MLAAAAPRPQQDSHGSVKNNYSARFANAMAVYIANSFRSRFPGIKPDPLWKGIESPSRALRGLKKLDVNFSTPQAGLGLGISLKSVHIPDKEPKQRYHHNMKRNDEELRVEAAGYHQRQPYSVLIGVVVLPFEACDDADKRPSSFGKWVQYLWPLARRADPQDDVDRFEHVFVALYGSKNGELAFFDVTEPPPKKGRPRKTLTLEGFVERVAETYEKRNSRDFRWESGERDPAAEEDDDEE